MKTLFAATALFVACGSPDREFCQKRNDKLATFTKNIKEFCAEETVFAPGASTVTACEKALKANCNDPDRAAADRFLSCLDPLDANITTDNGNVCAQLPASYQSCYDQHASAVRSACLTTLFGSRI